jgi:exopolysaccharide biosynthesis polyprenyl glycosylphosphotransferase
MVPSTRGAHELSDAVETRGQIASQQKSAVWEGNRSMNGAAARRSQSGSVVENVPAQEPFTEGVFPASAIPNGRGRGRNLVRGLPVQITYGVIDATLVLFVGAFLVWLRFGLPFPFAARHFEFDQAAGRAYAGFFLLYATLVVLGCANQNLYRTPRDRSVLDETLMVTKAIAAATVLLVLSIFISGDKEISRLVIISAGVLNVITLSEWRYLKRRLVLRRAVAGIGVSRILIVGAGRIGKALGRWLAENPHLGYSVCGFLDSEPTSDPRVLGTVEDLERIALTQFVDELFITLPAERELVKKTVVEARELGLGLKLVPDLYDGFGWKVPLHMLGGFPVMDLLWQPIPALGLAMKRLIDITVAACGMFLTAPLLALLAILIKFDSPGPVFYPSERVGRKGNRFKCYKLRTMVVDADLHKHKLRGANERQGPFFKLRNDPRITRMGRWLRKTSLDELPQLLNVLRGEMSLVGPRPHPVDDYELYSIEHLRRLDVSPGLTGLWQVTARKDPSFETNMALDLEYIENWSLGLDFKIMLKTIPAVFRAEGA